MTRELGGNGAKDDDGNVDGVVSSGTGKWPRKSPARSLVLYPYMACGVLSLMFRYELMIYDRVGVGFKSLLKEVGQAGR